MKTSRIRVFAVGLALALAAAACGSDSDGAGTATTNGAAETTTTAADGGDTTEGTGDDETEDTTNGGSTGGSTDSAASIPTPTGPADDSLEPMVIGVINMDEGTPSFPDVSDGIEAAAELINAELGGIQGRPVEIRLCNVGMDQASNQACAQEMANADDINVVINGYVFGSGFIFPIFEAAELPVLLQTPLTAPDFNATLAWGFQGGNAGGTAGTAGYAAKILDAQNIVMIGADNDATRAAVATMEALPSLEGRNLMTTYVSETAADVSADIQASGAADADAVLAIINTAQCVQIAQALADINVTAPVIATSTCATQLTLGEAPELFEGWHIVGSGLPPLVAAGESAEVDYWRETFPLYGDEAKLQSFHALGGFGSMLAIWTIGNDLPEDPSRADWAEGLASFTGPYFGGQETLSCPGIHFPAVCNNEVRAYVLNANGEATKVQDFFDALS